MKIPNSKSQIPNKSQKEKNKIQMGSLLPMVSLADKKILVLFSFLLFVFFFFLGIWPLGFWVYTYA